MGATLMPAIQTFELYAKKIIKMNQDEIWRGGEAGDENRGRAW